MLPDISPFALPTGWVFQRDHTGPPYGMPGWRILKCAHLYHPVDGLTRRVTGQGPDVPVLGIDW